MAASEQGLGHSPGSFSWPPSLAGGGDWGGPRHVRLGLRESGSI